MATRHTQKVRLPRVLASGHSRVHEQAQVRAGDEEDVAVAPHTTAACRTAHSTSRLATIHLVHKYARRLPSGVDARLSAFAFTPHTEVREPAEIAPASCPAPFLLTSTCL
ncbi:hypothetical protein [Streptomyces sp. t39]|uniref:hypothetical protein n=1 Tax=Streptomyces sp. t39 TaxID=1828156 RepID=UPI001C9C3783|nr:hypothetical protein [Streptomyces sp. t39]